ncbi:MAG TPA: 4-(cytidine 5'-diphospho)-2-C-methyl-D-erythritol kinase [Terriglobales bacterium]|nr:4-(cytidine 5'-diphospho)-2-C-methyl-D-erythritol kinase [Terriglobales bacterium]
MAVAVRSFAKINIGLVIGARRDDGFHDLRTVYQTIALHDVVKVELARGTGIEIRCSHPQVPCDESNTCHRMAERALRLLGRQGRVVVTIEKRLPVQGGLGAASSNAVATLLALERAAKGRIGWADKLRLAAEVGSDLPLFVVGGTVFGAGRGEEVLPLPDLPPLELVVATPKVGISTPAAFAAWDAMPSHPLRSTTRSAKDGAPAGSLAKLTARGGSDRIVVFSRSVFEWLGDSLTRPGTGAGGRNSGVPGGKGRRDRAEALLLDLVRTGIENDFERVVFSEHPELCQVKRVLERHGAKYASLSGSGSALYGIFASRDAAHKAARKVAAAGVPAVATRTLSRAEYWAGL